MSSYKQERYQITQRVLDRGYIDLKQLAKPNTTVLSVESDGVVTNKVQNIDYSVIDGGLFPLRVQTRADQNGDLNNTYFPLKCESNSTVFFVYYNVGGLGDIKVAYDKMNINLMTFARGIEVKLELNDNALIVAQKTAEALKLKLPHFFQCEVPADPDQYQDPQHPDVINGHQSSKLFIYHASLASYGLFSQPLEFGSTDSAYGQGDTGFIITRTAHPEKNSRITFTAQDKLTTLKIMCKVTMGSNKLYFDKDIQGIGFFARNGMKITGPGIAAGAVVTNTTNAGNLTPALPITKVAFSREATVVGDVSKVIPGFTFVSTTMPVGSGPGALYGPDLTTGGTIIMLGVPRSSAPGLTRNAAGAATAQMREASFQMSLPATATSTGYIELTLSWGPALSLKVGDFVDVQYDRDLMNRDLSRKVMVGVKHNGPLPSTPGDSSPSWLNAPATSTINMAYREGGDLKSTKVMIMTTPNVDQSWRNSKFLTDEYNLGVKVVCPEFHFPRQTNLSASTDQLPATINGNPAGNDWADQSYLNTVRAFVDFIVKYQALTKCGKVIAFGGGTGASAYVADAVRYRPDLFAGVIVGQPVFFAYDSNGAVNPNSAMAQYVTPTYPTSSYSLATITTGVSNQVATMNAHRDLWDGGTGVALTGDIPSMTAEQRRALLGFNFGVTGAAAAPQNHLNIPLAVSFAPYMEDSPYLADVYGQSVGLNVNSAPLSKWLSNTVPHLITSPTQALTAPGIWRAAEAFTYGIKNSPSGSSAVQYANAGGAFPGLFPQAAPAIASFIASLP